MPLVGLAEAFTTAYLRDLGLSPQRVTRFAEYVRHRSGDRYALATPKYWTDGLTEYVQGEDELHELYTGQGAFHQVVKPFLRELVVWPDGTAGAFRPRRLRTSAGADVIEIDPRYNAGRLSFRRNRVPLFAVVGSLDAGDRVDTVRRDYALSEDEVQLVDTHREWLRNVA